MFNFREKRVFERILYSKAMLGALSILFFFALSSVWGMYEKYHEAKQNKDVALAELESMEERVRTLESDIALLRTDRGVEKKIREEFGFAKEGEGVILIIPEEARADVPLAQKYSFFSSVLRSVERVLDMRN